MSKAQIDFDVLFIPDSLNVVNLIAPQLKYHGIGQLVLSGTNIWYSKQFSQIDGKYFENAVFPVGFYPERKARNTASFFNNFKEKTGEDPSYIDAIAYDTALLLMNKISTGNITSKEDLVRELGKVMFTNGVTCPLSFDHQGEPNGPLNLMQIKNEKIVLLKTSYSEEFDRSQRLGMR